MNASTLLLRAQKSADVVLAAVIAGIVAAMIVPLPGWLLDVGIALNLAGAAALLVASLYAREPLKLASFPTLLLITTLLRLGLNVSSTRLALSEGHAGEIIQAFGEFVVRGEYVVGTVVFAILALVQFLVVAKGAERVAEVSARFTLDGMPGKQMSIDADLRAGAIDQATASRRRRELERESQLFGAMDGAMKFVKGDVIAGLVIVFINLAGGISVGVLQNGMELAEAASTYALIAIGDGLVSQIPSLCVALSAGLLVTRVGADAEHQSFGVEIASQLFGDWKVLAIVAVLCLALGLLPGMPHATFVLIAGAAGALALWRRRSLGEQGHACEDGPASDSGEEPFPEAERPELGASVGVARLTLDLAPDLGGLTREEGGRLASSGLNRVREQIFLQLGIRVPSIRVRVDASYLPAGGYAFLIDEVPCARGRLALESLYAMVAPSELSFLGVAGEAEQDPATGKPITRVPLSQRERLASAQVPVLTPGDLLCEHLAAVIRRRAPALLGVQEAQELIDALEPQAPALVKEALLKVPLALLAEVLRKLLEEEVSIRDLRAILEALVSPSAAGDATALAERCRQRLHRYLSHKYAAGGSLFAYLVDPAIEETLRQAGPQAAVEPDQVARILSGVRKVASAGGRTVLLASPDVRRLLRRLCESAFPEVAVLTFGELDSDLQIRPLGRVAAA